MQSQFSDDLRRIVDESLSPTTGWGVAAALLILLVTWPAVLVVGWGVRALLGLIPDRGLIPDLRPGVVRLVTRLAQLVVVVVAIAGALTVLNVGPGLIVVVVVVVAIVGAVVVQAIIQNLAAGLALPYLVGDQVESHQYAGTVADITLRQTVIETLDRRKVYIPNVDVMANPIVVYSAFEDRRSSIEVGITYGTDMEAVSRILVDALSRVQGVHTDPSPYAKPSGFADGMYLLTLRWWHDPDLATEDRTMGAVLTTVKRTLDDAGIPIPPPAAIFLSEAPRTEPIA